MSVRDSIQPMPPFIRHDARIREQIEALVAMRPPSPPPPLPAAPRRPTPPAPRGDVQIPSVHSKIVDHKLKNISDDKLVVQTNTYIRNHVLDIDGVLRKEIYTRPTDRQLNVKIIDMMRQQIYAAQDRMRRLAPLLAKYKDDVALRMAFILNRLNQLIIDIRRIYTQALRWKKWWKRVFEHIVWYTYVVRKFVDILYIVEHAIELHTKNMKLVAI